MDFIFKILKSRTSERKGEKCGEREKNVEKGREMWRKDTGEKMKREKEDSF